ncbi:hypothetical protein LTR95_006852 [Oleoguttula sp. CCFEE 5521]
MTIRAMKFTPQVLLSTPRRSAGVPSPDGKFVLYTVSTYDFDKHMKSTETKLLDTDVNFVDTLPDGEKASDFVWLSSHEFAFLRGEDEGAASLMVCSRPEGTGKLSTSYVVERIEAPVANLKIASLGDDEFGTVFSAQATREGELFNPEKAPKTHSSGRLYSTLFARHWDEWATPEKQSLWYAKLSAPQDGKRTLSKVQNALSGSGLSSPIEPFGGTDNFDVSKWGLIFVAKDPELNPALHTKSDVYYLPIEWEGKGSLKSPTRVRIEGFEGASTSPVFSPSGKKAAFLSMKKDGYEADRNVIFVMPDLHAVKPHAEMALTGVEQTAVWDRSPSSIAWAADGTSLLVVAEEEGHAKLFEIHHNKPHKLFTPGVVSDVKTLSSGRIFVSGSTLVDNSYYAVIDLAAAVQSDSAPAIWSHSNTDSGVKLGLNSGQISSIWSPASDPRVNKEVHSWVFKPSDYDSSKTYPVAYLIHGGPQGAWNDAWSTRWNQAVFAEQGFIVIAPNVTGSTGYGQAFTDAINQNWGGDPYQDIVNVFDYVGKHIPQADNSRAVALGASYGGFMMNWIQGQPLGRKFKAMVCHDGIFSTANLLSTEELYFPFNDLGGYPWSTKETDAVHPFTTASAWHKWDPSAHLSEWATPMLVIHNSKDYRLPISEGLAAFNVLQAKGIDSQFLTFPDENHFVLKPENSLVWHKTVINWIRKHVGLEPFAGEEEEGA